MARLRDQRGSVAIIAVALLGVSLLLMAMIVDLGAVWLVKARVQTAADAATLAAVSNAKAVAVMEWVPDEPVTKEFTLFDTLPPAQDIKHVEPVYELQQAEGSWEEELVGYDVTYMHSGVEVVGYFPVGAPLPSDIVDLSPIYEDVYVEGPWEDVLVGYEVTYIETWTQQMTGMVVAIEDVTASQEALALFETNVQRERARGVHIDAETSVSKGDTYAVCNMTVRVESPSMILAPLMGLGGGQGGPRSFTFRVTSESRVALDW